MRNMTTHERKRKKRRLLERDGNCCCHCRKWFPSNMLTFEHIIPRSQGGTHALWNLRLACSPCNQARGTQPFYWFGLTKEVGHTDFSA